MTNPIVDLHELMMNNFYKQFYNNIDGDIYIAMTGPNHEFELCKQCGQIECECKK